MYRVHDLPWFRTLSWYLLICSNYYICGEYLIDYIGIALRKDVSTSLFVLKEHGTLKKFVSNERALVDEYLLQ